MKLLCVVIFLFMLSITAKAGNYTQVIGLVESIKSKNIANVYIYSRVCNGNREVEVENPSLLRQGFVKKVKLVMQINQSCTRVIIGPNIRGPQ